ncbi:VOC family protein [Sphingopyxis sp. R3-92]|uniref:VOC family protein n=1 Tax=Sphingopyxis sp. R3-92 TaxID=3158553 RepID=UPI003EE66CE2
MQQQIAVVTLGIGDLVRSRRFYSEGFGWTPVFANDEIAFYQMNGLVLGTWLEAKLAEDMTRTSFGGPRSFALAHNVGSAQEVDAVIAALEAAGGCCGRAMRRRMAAIGAMSPIPTITLGKSLGIPTGRSTPKAV